MNEEFKSIWIKDKNHSIEFKINSSFCSLYIYHKGVCIFSHFFYHDNIALSELNKWQKQLFNKILKHFSIKDIAKYRKKLPISSCEKNIKK